MMERGENNNYLLRAESLHVSSCYFIFNIDRVLLVGRRIKIESLLRQAVSPKALQLKIVFVSSMTWSHFPRASSATNFFSSLWFFSLILHAPSLLPKNRIHFHGFPEKNELNNNKKK